MGRPPYLALGLAALLALLPAPSGAAHDRTLQAVATPDGSSAINLYPMDRFFPMPEANGPPPVPACCANPAATELKSLETSPGCLDTKYLKTSRDSGYFYFYDGLQPAMVVNSGDVFEVEMPTPLGGNAYDEIVAGDPGMEELYAWTPEGPVQRGPFGNAFGHFMAGPIYVCGAEPGDVLQVEILDLKPHPNPGKDNRTWGATGNYGCGWQSKAGYLDGGSHQGMVVYEVITDPDTGKYLYWEPVYSYQAEDLEPVTTPCVPQNGSYLRSTPQGAATWSNPDYTFGGVHVPCVDGEQVWSYPYQYTGQIFTVPEDKRDYSIQGKYRLPVNMHIGNMALAPKLGAPVITNPPMRTGGNVDNRRIGIGATMYYPVEVEGGLLSMGDCHGSMGDGETSCTGIEVSLDGKFRVTLHKAGSLPKIVENLNYPLLENPNEYVIQAYTYADWIREIPNPQVEVFASGDLNRAYTVAFNQTREFLMNVYNLTETESISVMGAGIDFGVTQVVDGIYGIHSIIPKWLFDFSEPAPYIPKVMSGTSRGPEAA